MFPARPRIEKGVTMTQMYGADVAQLRMLAMQFDRAAEQLESGRANVSSSVHSSCWVGPDAHAFRAHWDSTDSARISAAARELRTGAKKLRANADGQERVSAVDGGGSSHGLHGGHSGGGGGGGGGGGWG